jgi:phosphatidylglycerol:prolipoprotein diacylglycerol transferase
MYPVVFRVGSLEVTSFGVMVALGALLGLLLMHRELRKSGQNAAAGTDAALTGVLGGLVGAKLLYVLEHAHEALGETLLSRGGMSWFGGLVGGVAAGLVVIRWRRLPVFPVLAAAAPALALGQAVGRIGCFLVGDDYGRPTSLPWGVSFPEGLPPTLVRVHPTQLYEAAALFLFAWLLARWLERGLRPRAVVGRYLLLAGGMRFVVEFIRINVPVLGPFTMAQLFAAAAVIAGVVLLVGFHERSHGGA